MTQTLNSISERLGSYAELGIKTLAELIEEDILIDGSSTPGDFCEGYFDPEFDDIEELRNIRGYLISKDNINETLYGRNGFFSVALEKQGEAINRADNLPIPELEKRLKNSALLLVRPDKLNINQRSDNGYDEDLALHSIAPEDIDHMLIDKSNLHLAKKTFSHLPTSIPVIGKTNSEIYQIFQGPCSVPDYAQALKDLTANGDVYWGHVIRLPSSE